MQRDLCLGERVSRARVDGSSAAGSPWDHLADDIIEVIAQIIADPLRPRIAVALSATGKTLHEPMRATIEGYLIGTLYRIVE